MIGRDMGHSLPAEAGGPQLPGDAARGERPELGAAARRTCRSQLGKGEILGLGGLDGQGQQRAVARRCSVCSRDVRGEIKIDGKPVMA